MGDARAYVCLGHRNNACANSIRVRRDTIEAAIIDPILKDVLTPVRVAAMVKEMERDYRARIAAAQARVTEVPDEVRKLEARIERLRERLRKGDEDMALDEIEAAIEKARGKLSELQRTTATAEGDVRVFARFPDAAEAFRRQISLGLDGNPVESAKARMLLRSTLGDIKLEAGDGGSLWASYELKAGELLQSAVTAGRGDRI
jgi:site-specific DNA recombinase